MSKIYRHYNKNNNKKFDNNLFKKINNKFTFGTKPRGGLWGSPVDSDNGWKDWCELEEPDWINEDDYFDFKLKDDANILYLESLEDVKALVESHTEWLFTKADIARAENARFIRHYYMYPDPRMYTSPSIYLDFEKMLKDGIDAIEVKIFDLYSVFYGWDCDTILVMNPKAIVLV